MPSDSLKATAEYPYVFPPLWFFWKALRANVFFLADTFKIPKRPRINRYRLAGAGGEHWLTVPVHRPEGWSSRIRDVRIVTDDNWKRSHLRTIENGYALAPYLDYYLDDLRELYGQASGDFLRFARATIEWLGRKLGLEAVQWVALSEVSDTLLGDEALVHAYAARQVRTYLVLAGSRDVKDEQGLRKAGVNVEVVAFPSFTYTNLLGQGDVHLSALDFLLNHGPEAKLRLREAAAAQT